MKRKRVPMLLRRLPKAAVILVIVTTVLTPQALPAQDESAFRKSGIVRLVVTGSYSEAEKASIIRTHCLSFEPTARDWRDLRTMGTPAAVLDAIRECAGSSEISVKAVQPVGAQEAAPEPEIEPVPAALLAATNEKARVAFELPAESIELVPVTDPLDPAGLTTVNVRTLIKELAPPVILAPARNADRSPAFSDQDRHIGGDSLARREGDTADDTTPPLDPWESEIRQSLRLGQEALAAGEARTAISHFRDALGRQPRNLTAQTGLARAYLLNGDSDDAVLFFHAASSQAPDSPKLWEELSQALSAAGKSDEARQARARAAELARESDL